jgi:hypothetical protein
MAQLRKTLTTNLGDVTDKDIIDFAKICNEAGVNDSQLIKECIRYWISTVGLVPPKRTVAVANPPSNQTPAPEGDMKEYIATIVQELVKNGLPAQPGTKPKVETKTKRKYTKRTNKGENNKTNKSASDEKVVEETDTPKALSKEEQEFIDRMRNTTEDKDIKIKTS